MAWAAHLPGSPALAMVDVTVILGGVKALDSVSLELAGGEQVALVGPNGAGKTTLIRTVAGLIEPAEGSVTVYGGRPPGHICIAYLPQRSAVDWSFPVTVQDVVMMGRVGRLGLLKRPSRHDDQVVAECLATVGLTPLAKRPIRALSGGEQQRMFIARALAQEAELMLMDEPMTGLDVPSQNAILDLLPELRRRGVATLVATHDLAMSAERFDRIVLLNRRVIADGPASVVFTEGHLVEAYGGHVHRIHTDTAPLAVSDSCCDRAVHT